MTRKINILLSVILILCAVGFLYTFVQPRYTATIVSIGRTRTVSSSGKHGRKSHKVVPMVVTFTDHAGAEQTVDATYRLLLSPYFTVTFTVALTPLFAMTVIVQVPMPRAFTTPFASTVATFLSLLK